MTQLIFPIVAEAARCAELWLPLERADDVNACGGKAASLGRMLRAGLPVPAGVVLTVHALHHYLEWRALASCIEAIEAEQAAGDAAVLAGIEGRVRALFAANPLPDDLRALLARIVAELPAAGRLVVRSSAVGEDAAHASYAGLLESVLDVDRRSGVEAAVKRVWASRWSARAFAYSRLQGRALGAVAVVLQIQVDARHAGVLFTRSPQPGRHGEMLCEYCAGLAPRLVAGEITPARLAIDRASLLATQRSQGDEGPDPLDPDCIEALATAAMAAERLFGGPQDIEWALDRNGRPWLVQSRPITTLPPGPARRRIVWSNANVNENFPAPISPLLYSIVAQGYTHYFANLARAFGLSRPRRERMAGDLAAVVGVHAGRLYYNLTAIHTLLREAPLGERLVAWFDQFTGACDPAQAEPAKRQPFVRTLRDAIELGVIAARTAGQYLFIERRIARFEARVDRFAERSAPHRLPAFELLELRDLLRGFMDIRRHRWTDAALADAAAMVCYGALKAVVARAIPGAERANLHNDLLKGLTGLKSAEPVTELWSLADAVRRDARLRVLFDQTAAADIDLCLATDPCHASFDARLRSYLERWGFRCSGELMLTVPSFQERPGELLEIIRAYAIQGDASPDERLARQRADRAATTARVLDEAARQRLMPRVPWLDHAMVLRPLLQATQAAIGLRERARLKQALLYSRLRRIALEIGTRLAGNGVLEHRDDVFFLAQAELDALLSGLAMFPGETRSLVALRRLAHARFAAQIAPDSITAADGEYPDVGSHAPVRIDAGSALRGLSVCGGIATGLARVLDDVSQTHRLATGDVLVTRQTDPGWAPAFVGIGALVLERGGMLSHGAILAREYGIPTLVGVAGATARIADGSTIRVDADHGDVHVLA